VSSPEVTEGEFVTVSGAIGPTVSDATVTLTYRKPDGSTITRTVTTGADGSYSDSYQPEGEGSWSVTASWDGDSTHEGASCSSQSFTVKARGCLIATATYGSELSPQVQFLRDFRDNTVLSTFAGNSFMTAFNGFYYSFSPNVASVIADNSDLKYMMKGLLYPLIGILQMSSATFSVFSFLPELGIIIAGLIASALIGISYFLPVALMIRYFKKFTVSEKLIHQLGLLWVSSISLLIIAEVLKVPSLMMVSTSLFVVVTIATTTFTSLRIVAKRFII
jgi:peptide/nickel transport system substrate-binding protein